MRIEGGEVVGPSGRIAVAEIARTWYRRPQDLPADVDPGGLELTAGYKAKRDTGTFSYAAHAAVVAVDPETGEVEILDYVVVEDGGVLVNPMIVDGQIWGGAAQGIGTALYEEMRFDAQGQPLASTLSDYLLPGPTEVPDIRILHMETPSPYTRFGQKGIGEGGAIAPPAAITNAVNDALKDTGRRAAGVADHAAAHRRGDRAGAPASAGRRMKPVAFDYARPASVARGRRAAGRQRRTRRSWPAARRSGPMLNLRLAQPALLVDITRIPELAAVTEDSERDHARRHGHACRHRGRPGAGPDRRFSRARRARHRLSRRAQPRHDRRQPGACRSGGRLAVVPDGARRRSGDRRAASGERRIALAGFVRGAMETELGDDEMRARHPHSPKFSPRRPLRLSTRSAARPASSPRPSASSCTIRTRGVRSRGGRRDQRRADRAGDDGRRRRDGACRPMRRGAPARPPAFAGDAYDLNAARGGPAARAMRRGAMPA